MNMDGSYALRRTPFYHDEDSRVGRSTGEERSVSLERFARRWTKTDAAFSPFSLQTQASSSPQQQSTPITEGRAGFGLHPAARTCLSHSPSEAGESSRSPAVGARDASLTPVGRDADLLQRLAFLESENAALKDRLASAKVPRDALVSELQQRVREVTLSRDAAHVALVALQEDRLRLQEQLREPSRRLPAQRDSQRTHSTGGEVHRSETREGGNVPSCRVDDHQMYVPSRSLFRRQVNGTASSSFRKDEPPAPLPHHHTSSTFSSLSQANTHDLTLEGIEELVKRSQRMREMVNSLTS